MIINKPQWANGMAECLKKIRFDQKDLSAMVVKSIANLRNPAVERWANGNKVLVAILYDESVPTLDTYGK